MYNPTGVLNGAPVHSITLNGGSFLHLVDGTATTAFTGVGDVTRVLNVDGTTATPVSTSSTLQKVVIVSGILDLGVSIIGDGIIMRELIGTLPFVMGVSGSVTPVKNLSGTIGIDVDFSGSIIWESMVPAPEERQFNARPERRGYIVPRGR